MKIETIMVNVSRRAALTIMLAAGVWLTVAPCALAQDTTSTVPSAVTTVTSTAAAQHTQEATALPDSAPAAVAEEEVAVGELMADEEMTELQEMAESMSLHQQLKSKFVEGSAGFMSLVAIALVLGLALCIERIIYLTLSEINARKLLTDIEKHLECNDVEGAKTLCRDTRGPVASVCYQGLLHADEPMDDIQRSIIGYGSVLSARLEKGCSWIRLFIAMAPSLGFLGTVIGMVMAFDQIQEAGDIGPTIVAEGMKVALITTIFGIIVALVLQVFYNFILNKVDHLTEQMEESAVTLMDMIAKTRKSRTGVKTTYLTD